MLLLKREKAAHLFGHNTKATIGHAVLHESASSIPRGVSAANNHILAILIGVRGVTSAEGSECEGSGRRTSSTRSQERCLGTPKGKAMLQ